MRNTKTCAIVSLILACLMLMGTFSGVFAASSADTATNAGGLTGAVAEAIEILGDIKWAEYSALYEGTKFYSGEDIKIDMSTAQYEAKLTEGEVLSYDYDANAKIDGVDCIVLPESGSVSFEVNVPESGLYAIGWDYYDLVCKSTNIERTLRINGTVPFNEVRNILMTKTWVDDYVKDENGNAVFEKDGVGNDRRPAKITAPCWKEYTVSDSTGYYNGAFYFYLEAGENTITVEAQKEPMAISNVVLKAYEKQMSYAEYKSYIEANYKPASADAYYYIEAEKSSSASDATLYPDTDFSSSITSPQSASVSRLNVIGGDTWQTMCQWIEWTVDVEEAGIYKIDTRFLQNSLEGLYVSRRLYIDGEIPFEEANNVKFTYDNGWQVDSLGDSNGAFSFYFDKGQHTIRLEVAYGELGSLVAELRETLNEINAIYIKILKIAGSSPDADTSYQFYARIPNEIKRMGDLATDLEAISAKFKEIGGGAGSNSATIDNVARVLQDMAIDSEGQIAKKFGVLKSYIGNLGTMLNTIAAQSLTLDYLVVRSPENTKTLKANGNIFQNFGYEIGRFIASFTMDNSSFVSTTSAEDAVTVEVWTTASRERTQIIRSLVDEDFAATHDNIAVNLKIVAAGTLLPATLSGQGPDVMMDVAQSDVVNYAVRGAVIDVSGYNGFDELITRFHESAITPITVALGSEDGHKATYGIPQTQAFDVMFYRKDVFADLGVNVPETWDEFYLVLAKLLSSNLQVGMIRTQAFLTSLIYQNGGSLYANGGTEIGFESDAALTAFTQICDFFNLYSCPLTYDAANRFRTGEVPLLIADYITFYNQFTVYATELKGLWGFTTIPGTRQADGSIDYSNVSTISAMVIMKDAVTRGTDEAAFEYLRWWSAENIQGDYANELIALLGPAGKYNTANYNAFNAMPWSASELKILNTVFTYLKGYPEMPGGYIITRYVDFALMETYNNDAVPSDALLDYVDTINSELKRKREELEDGKDTSRSFYVPSDSKSQ